jgi:prepilin-type N-terminal cleavage/methylation domain-containing protein
MNRRESGFTLIELLIVVVIIGILAAIAIPKFSSTREKAFFSAMKADLRNLASLQEVYYNEYYSFTTSLTSLGATISDGISVQIPEADNSGWSAQATHLGMPGESCAYYHGDATSVSPAVVEGTIACTS